MDTSSISSQDANPVEAIKLQLDITKQRVDESRRIISSLELLDLLDVPDGLRGNDAWNTVSSVVSRTILLVVENNTDISISDLSVLEKEIIEVTRMLRDSYQDPFRDLTRVDSWSQNTHYMRWPAAARHMSTTSNINIVNLVRSGNSNHNYTVNSNNSYSASLDSDQSNADDIQSTSFPQSSMPRLATNFEYDHSRRSEEGSSSSGSSATHVSHVLPRPGNVGGPPEIPDSDFGVPPVIPGLSSLHETIQSVTGPLQTTTTNLESITRELVTMNNTLKDIATALNKIANPERDAQVEHPQSPQRPASILSTGYEPPNLNQNAQPEVEHLPHPLSPLPEPLFSFAPAGSKSQNGEAADHGHATSVSATQQGSPSQRVEPMHIEPERRVDREHEEVDLALPRELHLPVGDTYNCFGFTLRRSSCHIC
ncbi:hypothetical protein VNI00_004497 [Paramarasmius palmivorus]|uniref:Uncharacterized protein n=1 Tax=Paramarasmius palmivorus TaxID=297713 RepID=A0AAW0DFA5_9AGAR